MAHTINFPQDFLDNQDIWLHKGFLDLEVVHDGAVYRLSFVDIPSVKLGLDEGKSNGLCYFTEPGMVIISEVTKKNISQTIDTLVKQGFLDTLKPLIKIS